MAEPTVSGDLEALVERNAEIVRLREALHSVRASLRQGQAVEAFIAFIARALDDPDAAVFVNSTMRHKLNRAAELCEKVVYVTRGAAEKAAEGVLDRHGSHQRAYFCGRCFLWHLTSRVREAAE